MTQTRAKVVQHVADGRSLRGADLQGIDLREANLRGADLQGAYLRWADLRGANLRETCLDPYASVPDASAALTAVGLAPASDGAVVAWRTAHSPIIDGDNYVPGQTYEAPVFSVDSQTDCHPGLYIWPKAMVERDYPGAPLVRVRFLVGDCVATGRREIPSPPICSAGILRTGEAGGHE